MSEEANRGEAEKCLRIAENAMADGDGAKATRFLQKAKRMNPNDSSIDELLQKAATCSQTPPESAGPRNGTSAGPSAESAGFRAHATTGTGNTAGSRTTKDGLSYTAEQAQMAQRILRTKDYYDILEVSRDANDDQIKKAYKKWALKLHPDKNKAPGAEEAFKKLSKAVQCLVDDEKKKAYDHYGDEDRVPQGHRHCNQADMAAEDIFAMFFGPGFATNVRHGGGGVQSVQFNPAQLMQMLPVILLVVLTLASNFTSNSNNSRFSFTATHQFRHERVTATIDTTYYVTDDFSDHYAEGTQRLADFDRSVEIYWVRHLHSECDYQDKSMYKKVMMAKRRNDQDALNKARRHPRPACQEVERIKKSYSSIYRTAMYMGGL